MASIHKLEDEFGRIYRDSPEGKKLTQKENLARFKAVSSAAKDKANETMRDMLKASRAKKLKDFLRKITRRPTRQTKLDEFIADANERNPNIINELAVSWAPVRVYRNDPKNDRITYEVPANNLRVLDDQMDTVAEIVTDATQQAMGEDADFIGQLIRDAVSGEREVEWTGAD